MNWICGWFFQWLRKGLSSLPGERADIWEDGNPSRRVGGQKYQFVGKSVGTPILVNLLLLVNLSPIHRFSPLALSLVRGLKSKATRTRELPEESLSCQEGELICRDFCFENDYGFLWVTLRINPKHLTLRKTKSSWIVWRPHIEKPVSSSASAWELADGLSSGKARIALFLAAVPISVDVSVASILRPMLIMRRNWLLEFLSKSPTQIGLTCTFSVLLALVSEVGKCNYRFSQYRAFQLTQVLFLPPNAFPSPVVSK